MRSRRVAASSKAVVKFRNVPPWRRKRQSCCCCCCCCCSTRFKRRRFRNQLNRWGQTSPSPAAAMYLQSAGNAASRSHPRHLALWRHLVVGWFFLVVLVVEPPFHASRALRRRNEPGWACEGRSGTIHTEDEDDPLRPVTSFTGDPLEVGAVRVIQFCTMASACSFTPSP